MGEDARDPRDAVHANNIGRDLVANGDPEYDSLPGTSIHRLLECSDRPLVDTPVRSPAGRLLAQPILVADADEQPQTGRVGRLKDVWRRRRVDADEIQSGIRHRAEVGLEALRLGIGRAIGTCSEAAVRHAAHAERLAGYGEMLPVYAYAQGSHLRLLFLPSGNGRRLSDLRVASTA